MFGQGLKNQSPLAKNQMIKKHETFKRLVIPLTMPFIRNVLYFVGIVGQNFVSVNFKALVIFQPLDNKN